MCCNNLDVKRFVAFVAFADLLPAVFLCGVRWLALAVVPGFSTACAASFAAMAPYVPWAVAWVALTYAAGYIFLNHAD